MNDGEVAGGDATREVVTRTPITLRDIAEAVGVHVSTASRALAQARDGLAPRSAAAARVVEVAADLGYQRDISAAGLRTRRSEMLGVLVPSLTDLAISTMYEGLEERASSLGYQAVVANTSDSPTEQRRRSRILLSRRIDGLILADVRTDDSYADELERLEVPFVLINRRQQGYDSVASDDFEGGRLAGQHLLSLGHRDIAVIAGEPYASTAVDRTNGCLDVLSRHGVHPPLEWVVQSTFSPQGGRDSALRLMSGARKPTAIFAVTDIVAIGAMGALRDLGMNVGGDVALIGFNDISLARELPIPLTTLRIPLREMGAQAATMLINRLRRGDAQSASNPIHSTFLPKLIIRASTQQSLG